MRKIKRINYLLFILAGIVFSHASNGQQTISDMVYIYPSGFGNTHIPYYTGDIYLTSFTGSGNGRFFFRTYNGSSYTERFRITADGKVGIGITSPTELLDINGNIRLQDNGGIKVNGNGYLHITNSNGGSLLVSGDPGTTTVLASNNHLELGTKKVKLYNRPYYF
jgi:hypothetical protein